MHKTTILIVEDEAIIAMDLTGKLSFLGYEVVGTARCGEEAIEMACSLRPHVLLMDIRLKGEMDGIEAAEAIHRQMDVPVIYLTAHTDAATLERIKPTGPYGFILKPFDERDISATIEMALYKYRADRQLRESEEKYRALVETTNTGFLILDGNGCVIDANQEYVRLSGHRELAEILGRRVEEWTADHDMKRNAEEVAKCIGQGSIRNLEIDYVDRIGKVTPIVINATVVGKGEATRILSLCRDITERKQAEEALRESEKRYRSVVENTTAIILRVNPDGVISFANGQALRFFGYAADELIGKHAVKTIIPEKETGGRDLVALISEIIADPDRFHTNANENICKDGRRVWIEWTNSGIYDAAGRLKEFLAVGIDATERKGAEEKIRRQMEEFSATNAELKRFNKASVDREMRMIELKKEVNELCRNLCIPPRYSLDFAEGKIP